MSMAILADACTPMSSNIAQKDLVGQEGQYPIYGASGLIGFVNFYRQEQQYIAVVKDGAGIGRVFSLPPYSSVIGTMQYLLPKDGIDVGYLYYALQFMHLEKYYTGSTIPHVYFKDYKREPLNIPSNDRQREIAETLGLVDEAIDTLNAQIATLGDLVKSRFIEMFGDCLGTGTVLSQLADITGGLTKNSKRHTFPVKMPYLRVANVFFNHLDLSEVLSIGVKENEIEKTTLQTGDLLFVEGNGSIEQIGRVAVWDGSIEPCLHQNHLIKARFDREQINPVYALFYFMSQDGRSQIVRKAVSTSGLHTLSVRKIESLELPVPPIDLQNQFADFVALTDKSEYGKLLHLQTSLKSTLLTGISLQSHN